MSQITLEQAEKIPVGSSSFFSLKNDKDIARVRFLYTDISEVKANAVHKVKVGDTFHTIGCLRGEMDSPLSTCPLCAANNRVQPRIYIQLLNLDTDQVQVWERSLDWFNKNLKPFFRRNPNLVGTPFEIERNGVAGDMKTTYGLFALQPDGATFESLGVELIDVEAEGIVKVLDYQELLDVVDGRGLPERFNNDTAVQSGDSNDTRGQQPPTDGSRRRTSRSF